jgi:hypothetical protein
MPPPTSDSSEDSKEDSNDDSNEEAEGKTKKKGLCLTVLSFNNDVFMQ